MGELLAQYKVPGASLAIIGQDELTTSYCYGMAQADRPVATSTCFQAASISKVINALAIMKLMALGRIELNDPVNKHLVSWKLPDNALTEKTAVTVRMLLTQLSQLARSFGDFAGADGGKSESNQWSAPGNRL